jgi:DNA-binding NarL/FixJ family response regulator
MNTIKSLIDQSQQLEKLFNLTKTDSAHFDKLIKSKNLEDKVAIVSGSDVDIRRFVDVLFSSEGTNITLVYLTRDNEIELLPEVVKTDKRITNIKNKDVNNPIRNKPVPGYGDLNIQINNSCNQEPVENLQNQNYPAFVNEQLLFNPKHLASASSCYFTRRERQVIPLVADGFSNKEIAQKLHLSTYTVKSHVHNILVKLSLTTRVQIAKHAYQNENYKNAI